MLSRRMRDQDPSEWPEMLLMLGDQIYADEVSPRTKEYISARRDLDQTPGPEVLDVDEYTMLYHEAWSQPTLRWLHSVLPTAMLFDDHDVHDDWNTSESWIADMRQTNWWGERIIAGLWTYWVYQHLGNLSPAELEADELYRQVRAADDAGPLLRQFATGAEREGGGGLWSFSRQVGGTRLLVLDGREGRVLSDSARDDGRGPVGVGDRAGDGRLRPRAAGQHPAGPLGAHAALRGGVERGGLPGRLGTVGHRVVREAGRHLEITIETTPADHRPALEVSLHKQIV